MNTTLLVSVFLFLCCTLQAQFQIFNSSNSPLPENSVTCLFVASDTSLWVGTDYGVAQLKYNQWTVYQTSNTLIPDNYIRAIAEDKQGNIWLGTFLEGIAILKGSSWEFYNTTNSVLPENQIRSIAFDTSGNAWIGTSAGLVYAADTGWTVFNIFNSPISGNNIASIYIDSFNVKWIGTLNGGLVKIADTVWTIYEMSNSGIPDNTIVDIQEDASGILWLSTPAAGIGLFNRTSWQYITPINTSLPEYSVNSVAINRNNHAYICLKESGLAHYKGVLQWTFWNTANSNIPQNDLSKCVIDKFGNLWIGTVSEGLLLLDTLTVSLRENKLTDIVSKIFPNPTNNELNIESYEFRLKTVTIYDVYGKIVLHQKIIDSFSIIDVSNLPKGTYFVEAENIKGAKGLTRFVKQ